MRLDPSDTRFLRADFGGADAYKLRTDDLLFTRYNGNRDFVGVCARVPELDSKTVYPDKLIRVRIRHDLADPRYVERAVHTAEARQFIAEKLKTSAGQVGISGADLKNLTIPLAPLPEQKRIADKLDTLLARVDNCRNHLARVPAILKRFRQSVLAAATSGELTEDWRDSEATEWCYERAADVCEKVQSGGTPKEGFVADGIPFLKVYNLVDQVVAFDYKPQFITPSVHAGSMRKSQTLPGDVLMNIVGPPLGKVAIVPSDRPSWNINQALALFRPSTHIASGWLYCVLCSGKNIENIVHDTRGSAGQVNISLSQCRDFVFPIPPAEEQAEIVRRVESLFALADQLEARYTTARTHIDRLTPALLAKAFRGELVPQDPGDTCANPTRGEGRVEPLSRKAKSEPNRR
jgi:type I restriction enzyme S subunit